jgi:hypothetical protein
MTYVPKPKEPGRRNHFCPDPEPHKNFYAAVQKELAKE